MDLHQARSGLRHHHLTPAEINAWDPLLDQKKLKPIGPIGKTYIQYLGTKENLPSKLEFFHHFLQMFSFQKRSQVMSKPPLLQNIFPFHNFHNIYLGRASVWVAPFVMCKASRHPRV